MSVGQRNDSGNNVERRPSGGRPDLTGARIVSALMYASILGFIYVSAAIKLPRTNGVPSFLPWVLLAVAILEYMASLILEAQLIREGKLRETARTMSAGSLESAAIVPAVVISAFGVSIAVYGMVLGLLGYWPWPWYFYGLGALHGIHLQLRWDRYEEAVRRAQG